MQGIPRAPGRRAYSSVGREVGAVCVERLAVFVSNIQSFRSVVQKRLASESGFLLGPVTGLSWGKRKFWRTWRSSSG